MNTMKSMNRQVHRGLVHTTLAHMSTRLKDLCVLYMSWKPKLGWLQRLSTLSISICPTTFSPNEMIINPSNLCFLQGWAEDLLCCLELCSASVLHFYRWGKSWGPTCTCGVCLYTNTTCSFLETVPQSRRIGNKTTLEKAHTGMSPKDWSYPKPKGMFSPP